MPYCCVPATLQWILYRRGLDIFDQEYIGASLGLRLPVKGKAFFQNKNIIFTNNEPKDGYGTQIEKEKYSIGGFFEENKIPLKISDLIIIDNKKALEELLIDNLLAENDIILRYNNIITKSRGQTSYGHFSVVCQFDKAKSLVIIGDPEPPFFKEVSLADVIYSTTKRVDGVQRGLYLVRDRL